MITRDTLKQIVMLTYLTDDMLDELVPITELLQFDEKEYVFRQGDSADRYYSILQGIILLEQRIGSGITISLSSIKQGYSIGWSAMLDGSEESYSTDAICAEPTQLLSFRAKKLKGLFEQNHHLGYIMSQRLLHVVKKRYDIRTEQFIRAIKDHPDLGALF